jgi:hypothetical protein
MTMKRFLVAAGLLAAIAAGPACAQGDALYQQLGGQPGLVRLMDDFMVRLLADKRMQPFFKDVDQAHVKAQLVAQFCEVSGGPCTLKGPDMPPSTRWSRCCSNRWTRMASRSARRTGCSRSWRRCIATSST